ncbi:hypothetical protein [Streptomyces sp. NPDC005209]
MSAMSAMSVYGETSGASGLQVRADERGRAVKGRVALVQDWWG